MVQNTLFNTGMQIIFTSEFLILYLSNHANDVTN